MIRELEEKDIAECVKVIRESFGTVAEEFGFTPQNAPGFTAFATTEEKMKERLMVERRPMYIYCEEDRIVGFYFLELQDENACELNNLCVSPAYRHRGIGEELLQHAFERVKELNCNKIRIGIVEENQVLRKWYESFGFIHLWAHKSERFPFTCGFMEKELFEGFSGREKVMMSDKKNYIQWIRSKVGHEKIILVFAGGCIRNDKGEVLLQRRGDTNKWGFPGGAIELGETPEMAAIREAKEETGLDEEVGKIIGVYTDCDMKYASGDEAHSIMIGYELKVVGGELYCDGGETLELKYFAPDDMPELFCKQHEEFWRDITKIKACNVI